MNQNEILNLLNNQLKEEHIELVLNKKDLDTIIIDTTRILDTKISKYINTLKKEKNFKLTSIEKLKLRKKLIGYNTQNIYEDIEPYSISKEDIAEAYKLINKGFEKNYHAVLKSLVAKSVENYLPSNINKNNEYINYIHTLQNGFNQLTILKILGSDNLTHNDIAKIVEQTYDKLSNYHFMIIIFENDHKTINWETIANVSVFMENFRTEMNFSVFNKKNKDKRVNELTKFVENNKNINFSNDIKEDINHFYEGVNYGFQFQDLYISNDGNSKVLIMQKVELDETPKKCPSCHEEIVRGNSYPKILYKSFECQNPSCPSRSKIGRGKRYDLYSAKRVSMLERYAEEDLINNDIYKSFRKDIIDSSDISIESLISLYSWSGDNIQTINCNYLNDNYKNRKIENTTLNDWNFSNKLGSVESLKIFKLMKSIKNNIDIEPSQPHEIKVNKIGEAHVLNGDSSTIIPNLKKIINCGTIGGAITSPPYYNAREYSQWDNILCYYIDMMINSCTIYNILDEEGAYIYNIGDIVGIDNIYIHSNMSKRRQMLGFYSMFIFNIIGFRVDANIIWDKGEVQSKRNSTPNHISGYLKPINSYEHCIVLKKSNYLTNLTEIKKIEVVRKINSKGVNILGHTAPFPIEIANLIIPYLKKDAYVLEPYLGSGTTCIAMNDLGVKSIGIELDVKYYDLAIKRINNYLKQEKQLELL